MNAIEIQSLRKTYDTGDKALKGIDLNIKQGSFFGLLGPNGAGKTTTIGILTGLVNKTSGSAKILGHDIITDFKPARKSIGLSPQEINLDVFFSVRQILLFQAGYYGVPQKLAEDRVDTILKKLDLYNKRNETSRHLSGGMKRRIQIAKALVHNPPILILDEPTAGVDIELRHMLWDYLKELNKEGKTILLTTHYIEEAEKLCDEIAIINNGNIIKQGETKSIIKEVSLNTIEVEVDKPNDIKLPDNFDFLVNDNIIKIQTKEVNKEITTIIREIEKTANINNINIINSSLEDAFLKLTNK
ncbi:MAG: ABC transporter [Candidatus Marinimicrobia bacterium]|jgi:ABC-2 type transport system ATP-binding protein|nr:ABC transporter [Candidatus Neomarinimicrobiota bacterium]|tara:strand:+ start:877 stop:1779 length:903 start_codon:yes stop_codon:yes gene_type:complete